MRTATFQFQSPAVQWMARASSLNCLSCRNPYQTPDSLNCLPPFHWKPLFSLNSASLHPLPKNRLWNEDFWLSFFWLPQRAQFFFNQFCARMQSKYCDHWKIRTKTTEFLAYQKGKRTRSGRGTARRCTGPKWSKMIKTTILAKSLYSEPNFCIRETTNRSQGTPDMLTREGWWPRRTHFRSLRCACRGFRPRYDWGVLFSQLLAIRQAQRQHQPPECCDSVGLIESQSQVLASGEKTAKMGFGHLGKNSRTWAVSCFAFGYFFASLARGLKLALQQANGITIPLLWWSCKLISQLWGTMLGCNIKQFLSRLAKGEQQSRTTWDTDAMSLCLILQEQGGGVVLGVSPQPHTDH